MRSRASSSCSLADVAMPTWWPSPRSRSTSARAPGSPVTRGRYFSRKMAERRADSAWPCGESSDSPVSSGSTLSPPLPISARTRSNGTSYPASASESTQAIACWSLLWTSVPSTSKMTCTSAFLSAEAHGGGFGQIERGERRHRGPVQHRARRAESRPVARAIPRPLRRVPCDITLHVRADRRQGMEGALVVPVHGVLPSLDREQPPFPPGDEGGIVSLRVGVRQAVADDVFRVVDV